MHETRSIRYIRNEDLGDWQIKVYGIGTHAPDARPEFVDATVEAARGAFPDGGGTGFVIAHDARGAGLSLVYWWANDNEIHLRTFVSPLDDPAALEPFSSTGMACVWELEIIDFERRAFLEHVLKGGDIDAYLTATAPDAEV
jgi:hypothetical protein